MSPSGWLFLLPPEEEQSEYQHDDQKKEEEKARSWIQWHEAFLYFNQGESINWLFVRMKQWTNEESSE